LTTASFGPNTFPANNSALFACETQVVYAVKSLFIPILDRRTRTVEVKHSAEEKHTNNIHAQLQRTVFAGDCSNWYIGKYGRNAASWPAKAAKFWLATYFPDWRAFSWTGGSALWPAYAVRRWVWVNVSLWRVLVVAGVVYAGIARGSGGGAASVLVDALKVGLGGLRDKLALLF
jgi:hypothetical protein